MVMSDRILLPLTRALRLVALSIHVNELEAKEPKDRGG